MLKLHLGCGEKLLPNYVNIDRRDLPGVDRVDDIGTLAEYEPNSVEEIFCCHALDHFTRWEYKPVLRRWFELLQPGGMLRISTPDFAATVERYKQTGDLSELIGQLYARQDYHDNVRHWIWDLKMARTDLYEIGFCEVGLYVPCWRPGHKPENDCSLLTWDCGDGRQLPRSLNITARKPE